MNQEFSERNFAAERRAQYGPSFPAESLRQRADDIRRELILKYARPEYRLNAQPRDLWREMAKDILNIAGNRPETIGMDVGTSSGYLIDVLLDEGYVGKLVATDIETTHFPQLREWIDKNFPTADIDLGSSNAETLRRVKIHAGAAHPVLSDSIDFVVVANVLHHTAQPEAVFNAVHRVLKPGGIALFAGRNVTHLANLYEFAKPVARKFNTDQPQSFYHKHDFELIKRELNDMSEYEILEVNEQGTPTDPEAERELLWIPNTEEGRSDYWNAFYTLLPMMKQVDKRGPLTRVEVEDFIESEMRPYLEDLANFYGGNFPEGLSQGYVVSRAVK